MNESELLAQVQATSAALAADLERTLTQSEQSLARIEAGSEAALSGLDGSLNQAVAQAELAAAAGVVEAEAAAAKALAQGQAVADLDLGLGQAAALLGTTQAKAVFQLTQIVVKEELFPLLPALLALEAAGITAGLTAYVTSQNAAKAIKGVVSQQAQVAQAQARQTLSQDLKRIEN